jgi:hypothetical protein
MPAALLMVRFNGRYYVEYAPLQHDDGPFLYKPDIEISSIPTEPEQYEGMHPLRPDHSHRQAH